MKTTLKHNMLLTGTVLTLAFMSCQREADKTNVSPYYDPDTETVKTEFVLSVSTNTGKDTKTTAEMAQVGDNTPFLGMDQVHLLAYNLDEYNYTSSDGHFFYKPVVGGNAVSASRDYDLGTLFGAGTVTTNHSSRSVELSLPLGTNAVAFYGKATKTYDSDLQGSSLTTGDPNDLTTLKFSLESRLTSMDAFDVGAFFFSRVLSYIMASALINEAGTFWTTAIGTEDKSYHFWYPIPSEEDAAALAVAVQNPVDQSTHTIGTVTYTYYAGELSWKQLGQMYYYLTDSSTETDPNTLVKTKNDHAFESHPLGESLGNAYYVMTTIKSTTSYEELRAGSASSVLRTVQDLYSIVERGVNAVPTSWEEQCVKLLCIDIQSRILNFFTMTNGTLYYLKGTDGKYDVTSLKTRVESSTSASDWNTVSAKVYAMGDDDLRAYFPDVQNGYYGFPVNVGLPFGAAIISCAADLANQHVRDRFDYVKSIPAYGFGTETFPIANYRYPPELMYYGNSSLRTTNEVLKSTDYPSSVSAWNTEGQWTTHHWEKHTAVNSQTRSVAMVNNINYGTALLKSTVKFADNITVLKDNNHALHETEEDQSIPINGGGFLVTGIIIGGQPDEVGWDYCRRPNNGAYANLVWNTTDKVFDNFVATDNKFDKMIYDRVVGGYQVGATTTPIYTMAWDNYDATKAADAQSDVYVGLELLNQTEMDFWGELNLVRAGGVFYLLGKLDLSAAVNNARDPNKGGQEGAFTDLSRNNYCYPPFNPATGETINAPRVFMQDYMTTATLVLGTDCLKHAYVTLPDLRSSQVSLGVSIDMTWTPGLAFDVNMGVMD